MADTAGTKPHYQVMECASPQAVTRYLNEMHAQGYRLVSITPISTTDHFSKEVGTIAWVVVELREGAE